MIPGPNPKLKAEKNRCSLSKKWRLHTMATLCQGVEINLRYFLSTNNVKGFWTRIQCLFTFWGLIWLILIFKPYKFLLRLLRTCCASGKFQMLLGHSFIHTPTHTHTHVDPGYTYTNTHTHSTEGLARCDMEHV